MIVKKVGCYKDTWNRAVPTLEGKDGLLDGRYRTRRDAINKCAKAAKKRGYKVFAVQHGGWCASSATAQYTYDKYGVSTACESDGEGGPWANQVYTIGGLCLQLSRRDIEAICPRSKRFFSSIYLHYSIIGYPAVRLVCSKNDYKTNCTFFGV